MTFRIVTTPLQTAPEWPAPRSGGLAPALLEAFVAGPGTAALLERLRAPGVLVVTTGQQPALFTGPLYTLHKAISAAALAAQLERRWGRPVVPVFWSAGDDHDYAEARSAAWLDADGALRASALPPRPADAPLVPMYRLPLDAEVEALVAELAAGIAPAEYAERTADWLARHYVAGRTLGAAASGALAELLAPLGIAVFDPTHPAAKRAAAPHVLTALRDAAALERALVERSAALAADGAPDPGVAVGDGATLVMLEAGQGRDRLVRDGAGFVTRRSGERFTLAELERIAAAEPTRLSANVLLRPAVESALLPTVAYVAGPGELRYLRLAEGLYGPLAIERQQPVPRWSGVIVERRVDRVLEKFGLDVAALREPAGALERRLVRSAMPPEADRALAALRDALTREYGAFGRAAAEVDPTLERHVARIRDEALLGAETVERKLLRHLRRRETTELAQLARARTAIQPDGAPQERVLTPATFLARQGPALLAQLRADAGAWYAGALEGAPVPS